MQRPFGVTLVGVIILIWGILGLIASVIGLFAGGLEWGMVLAFVFGIIISLIYIAVAKGLFGGSAGARLIVGIITVIQLLVGIWGLIFAHGNSALITQAAVQIIVSIVVLALLYNAKASAFFNANSGV